MRLPPLRVGNGILPHAEAKCPILELHIDLLERQKGDS